MKIALDPYMFRRVPLPDLPGLVAELGYSYLELSPRADFLPFFTHPRADRAQIAQFKKALEAADVEISSVLPLYRVRVRLGGTRPRVVHLQPRAGPAVPVLPRRATMRAPITALGRPG